MSDKHEIRSGHVVIPGAIANKDDYQNDGDSGAKLIINPPPSDGNCYICGKNVDELEPFGGAGDPLAGDFTGMKLVKKFREEMPDYIGSSWECRDCFVKQGTKWELEEEERLGCELPDGERQKMRKTIQWNMMEARKVDSEQFYQDILHYVQGKPNGIRAGTNGERKAKYANRLSRENPALLLPQNKERLMFEIDFEFGDL